MRAVDARRERGAPFMPRAYTSLMRSEERGAVNA
jgi:hypothetical protein